MRTALAAFAALAFGLAGCGGPAPGDCPDGGACNDGGGVGLFADVPRTNRWIPYVDGSFVRVFRPAGTRYLNDHTLVRGPDSRWHLYGITHHSAGSPHAEREFLHATAPALTGPWQEQDDVLALMPGQPGVRWAPFVVEPEPNHWVMYFWGDTPDHRTQRADSADLTTWTLDARSAPGGRDPFVLRVGERWYLYSVGMNAAMHGTIVVTSSTDLEHWSAAATALEDPKWILGWGNLESPTVVVRDDGYYLFITRTSESNADYGRTVVFHSTDPTRFAWAPVTEMLTHAAEVFEVGGQGYITAAGWTSMLGERWRGLSIARLGWARQIAP